MLRTVLTTVLCVLAPAGCSISLAAQALAPQRSLGDRIAELEKQLAELKAEVNKENTSAHGAAAASAPGDPAKTTPTLVGLSAVLDGTTLDALVDGYYAYNVNQPANRISQLRSFDRPGNQFALNLVELTVDKQPDANNSRMGYHVALGFGQAMNAVNGTDPGGVGFAQYVKEAYFSYLAPAGKGLQVDFGKFVTPHGAEVIESNANWNYSRGLLFSFAIPYYHFGMRAKYAFNAKYSLTAGVVNGWNNVVENNSGKTVGMSFAWTPTKKWAITENYMAGPETKGTSSHWRQLTDTVVSFSPTARLSLMANVDYGRGDRIEGLSRPVYWTGGAGYLRYLVSTKTAIAVRYEYYNDHDGFTTGAAQHINGLTSTLERQIGQHLITRMEYRQDRSNRPAFLKGESPVKAQSTVAIGMMFVLDHNGEK